MLSTTTKVAETKSSEIHTLNLKHMELVQEVEKYKSKMDDKEAQVSLGVIGSYEAHITSGVRE